MRWAKSSANGALSVVAEMNEQVTWKIIFDIRLIRISEWVCFHHRKNTHSPNAFIYTHTQHSEKLLRSVERTAQCLLFAQFEYHLMNSSSIVIIGCVAFCNSHQLINCRLLKILIKFKGNTHTHTNLLAMNGQSHQNKPPLCRCR